MKYTPNGNTLFYEPECGIFFKSSPLAVLEAEFEFNRSLAIGTSLGSLSDFYEYLKLEPPEGSYKVGWNYTYLAEEWCCMWVDFVHTPQIRKDGIPYLEISYPMEPKSMDYMEDKYD